MVSDAFVPLVAGAFKTGESAGPVRLKPISFEPTPQPKAPAVAPEAHVQHGPPQVTLERQGDLITHIRVQCGCGQVMELKCEY